MITATFIVDTRRATKKGFPIKIRIYNKDSKQNSYITTGKYQFADELIIDTEIRRLQYQLDERLMYCQRNNLNFDTSLDILKNGIPDNDIDLEIKLLESKLSELKKKKPSIGFIDFSNKYIREKEVKGERVDLFNTAINHFTKYLHPNQDIHINAIDYNFVNGLDLYFRNVKSSNNKTKCLSNATINTYFEKYSHIYNEAKKYDHLNIKDKNPFALIDIKPISDRTKKDYTLQELKEYFNSDLIFKNSKHPERAFARKARDIHKFQFLIGGHDLVDVALLKWSNIIDGRLVFKRYKNRKHKFQGKTISNMLHPLALEIIEMHGDRNNDRIFSFIHNPEENYRLYRNKRQYFDKTYKIIEEEFNFSETKLRSKTMRYTFRTIAGNLMINQMIIENLMGHINNSISMGYQGATPYEIQDAEHLKIICEVFK